MSPEKRIYDQIIITDGIKAQINRIAEKPVEIIKKPRKSKKTEEKKE